MIIHILSLFPAYFHSPFDQSLIKKAREKGILDIRLVDIREFSKERHKKVDDTPYGGGPGMVLGPEAVCAAIRQVKKEGSKVIYLSPQGERLNHALCEELSKEKELILLSGHYEGIDERVLEKEVDREISIGDYVLTSGCPAIIVLVDAVCRFIEGVIKDPMSAQQDSFQDGLFDAPQYTRPRVFEGMEVPAILLEGDHAKIEKWRTEKKLEKTARIRPDLLKEKKS